MFGTRFKPSSVSIRLAFLLVINPFHTCSIYIEHEIVTQMQTNCYPFLTRFLPGTDSSLYVPKAMPRKPGVYTGINGTTEFITVHIGWNISVCEVNNPPLSQTKLGNISSWLTLEQNTIYNKPLSN